LAFTFRKLTSDHAIEWQTLKLEGVEDFPLGFLITPEEALKTTKDRARTHLNFGTTRGVFYHNTLVGFCGYRPELFERTRHRAQIGPFFVRPKYQGTGAAQCLMSGVIQEARAAKIAQLELFVDTENYRAIRFYEKTDLNGLRHIQMAFGWALNRAMTIFTALDWGHSRTAVLSPDTTAL
jgi:ribosomal protein S18 acetylase RimI-like enzyme